MGFQSFLKINQSFYYENSKAKYIFFFNAIGLVSVSLIVLLSFFVLSIETILFYSCLVTIPLFVTNLYLYYKKNILLTSKLSLVTILIGSLSFLSQDYPVFITFMVLMILSSIFISENTFIFFSGIIIIVSVLSIKMAIELQYIQIETIQASIQDQSDLIIIFILFFSLISYSIVLYYLVEKGLERSKEQFETNKLLKSEDFKLREAQNLAHTGYWEWDFNSRNLKWSEVVYQIFDLKQQEIILNFDVYLTFIQNEDLDFFKEKIHSFITESTPFEMTYKIVSNKGIVKYLYDKCKIHVDEEGKIKTAIGTISDITIFKQAENALRDSEERYRAIVELSPDAVLVYNQKYLITFVNDSAVALLKAKSKEEILGRDIEDFVHQDSLEAAKESFVHLFSNHGKIDSIEAKAQCLNGMIKYLQVSSIYLKYNNEDSVLSVFRDISQLKYNQQRLELTERVFINSREGILITDSATRIIRANPAFTQMTGYREEELIHHTPNVLNSGWHSKDFFNMVWKSINELGFWTGEVWDRKKDGHTFAAEMTIFVVKDKNGKAMNYISMSNDVTDRKEKEKSIYKLAYFDFLTGLPNRSLFQERVEHRIQLSKKENNPFAILYLDLDNFKVVNDSLGHFVGDKCLVKIANDISHLLGMQDTLSRVSGDEFIVLISSFEKEEDVITIIEKIFESISKPIDIDQQLLHLGVSIGVSLFPDDGQDYHTLIKNADTAMYNAKSAGKNNYQFFTHEMNNKAVQRFNYEVELRKALANKEYYLVYQCKVDSKTSNIVGLEALLRWENSVLGEVSPNIFVPIMEEIGIIVEIGQWVMEQAIKDYSSILSINPSMNLSINVSARQLYHKNFLNNMINILDSTKISKKNLEFEITESIIMESFEEACNILKEVRNLGIQISIDDFGTGYSSMNQLKHLPIDIIKIDRTFVKDLYHNEEDFLINKAIISLAQSLNLKTVAEGVENKDQARILGDLGCNILQGFYFFKPMKIEELLKTIKKLS